LVEDVLDEILDQADEWPIDTEQVIDFLVVW